VICGVNKVAYHPGSLTYLDFGERKDKKSFLVVEFTAGKFLVKTVPVHPTPIYQLDISSDTFNIEILKNIEPTARVKVKITYSDPAINKLEFIKQLRKINVKEMKIVFKFLSPGLEELRANQSPNYGVTIEELFPKFVEEFNIDEEVVKLIRKNL
jgi:DNA repair exonuclease SbcCD nuclease subunit